MNRDIVVKTESVGHWRYLPEEFEDASEQWIAAWRDYDHGTYVIFSDDETPPRRKAEDAQVG